jgi:hypothetical protein
MIAKGLWKYGRPLPARPADAPRTNEHDVRLEKVRQLGAKLLYVTNHYNILELKSAIERV